MGQADDELAHAQYWDERYKNENGEELETYDWFRTWEQLETWFRSHLMSEELIQPQILHLGCGNSTLTADLQTLGFNRQTNIDFSEVVITAMKIRYENLNAEWKVMDVRDMKLESQSFDVAIDKATMDSMFHGSMWDPPDDVRTNIESYLSEVDRVLAPSGTFLYITYRQPHFMKPLLARVAWDLTVESLPDRPGGGVFEYFVYVMKKRGTSDIRDTSGANTEEGSEVSLSSSSSQVSLNSSDTSGDS